MLLVFLYLLARSLGLYPSVLADEYYYSKFARLLPFGEAILPNYGYFAVYRLTNFCGDQYLGCARLLNAVFFVLAAPFIYALAGKVTNRPTALLIAALSIIAPASLYTMFFMPEAMYYLLFWASLYAVAALRAERPLWHWTAVGAVLGLAALVKPHMLFAFPGLLVYLDWLQRNEAALPLGRRLLNTTALFMTALLVKAGFGLLVAGTAGLSLFGRFYASTPSAWLTPERWPELVRLLLQSGSGHALAVCLLYGCGVAALLPVARQLFRSGSRPSDATRIALLSLLLMLDLLAMTAAFSAGIVGIDPSQSIERLHLRYYDFALPLLMLAVADQTGGTADATRGMARVGSGSLVAIAIGYSMHTGFGDFRPDTVDSPDLVVFTYNHTIFQCAAVFSLLTVLLWIYSASAGRRVFLFGFMPLTLAFSALALTWSMHQRRMHADPFEQAGIVARHLLDPGQRATTVAVGSDTFGLYRLLFQLDSAQASSVVLAPGAEYRATDVPAGMRWVLAGDDVVLPEPDFAQRIRLNGFTLARVAGER